jgi:hypothetical protein
MCEIGARGFISPSVGAPTPCDHVQFPNTEILDVGFSISLSSPIIVL